MKPLLQVIFLLALSLSSVHGLEFKEVKIIKLKKDEQKKILVNYGKYSKLLTFRWTLYKNDGLVVFHSYDQYVFQNILYLKYKNKFFKQELKSRGGDYYNTPYILVKFKEFNYETREAVFELLLSDSKAQINLNYLED